MSAESPNRRNFVRNAATAAAGAASSPGVPAFAARTGVTTASAPP
ncbi:MAG: hypothetical protein R2748_27525 [Bryobacterales bacterium]